ncbi:hypothetical protein Bhyg_03223 [Pseudolycoriella hygida]|uniref:Uncharacterized protein n=1 Tax=Pseudolycoriella hygida TaxID=35572 RepID=A0A9Q0ND99_9DIPT|nr:hypothetical protein Bhyg_03223 [Pseudolycoriella hygida]
MIAKKFEDRLAEKVQTKHIAKWPMVVHPTGGGIKVGSIAFGFV